MPSNSNFFWVSSYRPQNSHRVIAAPEPVMELLAGILPLAPLPVDISIQPRYFKFAAQKSAWRQCCNFSKSIDALEGARHDNHNKHDNRIRTHKIQGNCSWDLQGWHSHFHLQKVNPNAESLMSEIVTFMSGRLEGVPQTQEDVVV